MLALAQSPLKKHYADLMDAVWRQDEGCWLEFTSYGESVCQLTGADLLHLLNPYADIEAMTERELDWHLHFVAGVPPPPPQQLSMF